MLDLNGSGNGLNQGAILSGAALPFTTGGFNLLGGNAPGFNNVMITFANADIRDAEKETIDVGGSTIALNAS
ncbi:hypothetical protein JZU54_02470, partial [bacterium]|nr:hypothetical protein [bacterium]